MPFTPATSPSFRSDHALRGARGRARELDILTEFWSRVSAGDLNGAMGRLALEEEREYRRRARKTSMLLLWGVTSALLSLGLRAWGA